MCHALVQWQTGRSQSSQLAAGKVCFFELGSSLGSPSILRMYLVTYRSP